MDTHYRKSKLKIRWNYILLPLIILPLLLCIVLSLAVFFVSKEQLQKSGQMSVEKFRIQAESILNELKIVNDSLVNDEYFLSLLNSGENDVFDKTAIVRALGLRLTNSSYIQDIVLICESRNIVYNAKAYYNYDSSAVLLRNAINVPYLTTIINKEELLPGWNHPDNSYSSPYYVSKITTNNRDEATLVVILDKAYLYRSLTAVNSVFCCMFNNDFVISSDLKNDIGIDYTSKSYISRLTGYPVELFTIETDSYTYVTALSRTDFYRPIYIIIISFGCYFLLVLTFSAVYVSFVNKREKAFFSSIISELPQPVSGRSDIDGILSSIQTALNDYKEEHSAFSEQKKYRNLERLCQGYFANSIDGELIQSMDIDPNVSKYYVIRFHFDEAGILNPAHRTDLISIIIETSLNGFSESRFRAVCFPYQHEDICGILNVSDETLNTDDIEKIISQLRTLLEKDYGIIFICTLSRSVSDIHDTPGAFQETRELLRFVHSIDSNAGFVSDERMKTSPNFLVKGEFLKQMQVLSGTLLVGKYDMVPEMVDTILEDHVAPLRKNYSFVEERLRCIKSLLYEAPLPSWLSDEQVEQIHDDLKSADSISALSENVHACFDTLKENKEEELSLVDRACEYVQDNIANVSLSVPEIAESVGVSVQHLAKLFKADKGMTMVEYINLYRINKAQELLIETNDTVIEIAEQTGYTNNVTFTRNFKRFVGCTPSEFRMKETASRQ